MYRIFGIFDRHIIQKNLFYGISDPCNYFIEYLIPVRQYCYDSFRLLKKILFLRQLFRTYILLYSNLIFNTFMVLNEKRASHHIIKFLVCNFLKVILLHSYHYSRIKIFCRDGDISLSTQHLPYSSPLLLFPRTQLVKTYLKVFSKISFFYAKEINLLNIVHHPTTSLSIGQNLSPKVKMGLGRGAIEMTNTAMLYKDS